jgi:predicted amidohydrolase
MPFKLAMVQMRVEPGAKERNLFHAAKLVGQAAAQGAQVVVLPEALPLGWTDSSTRDLADEIPGGETCRRLGEIARDHGIHVCSGVVERAGDSIFNAAVLIGPSGDVLLHHRKLNELEIAHDSYAQGDRLAVTHAPLGCLGIMICADAFARGQIVSRTLGLMGAQMILSPCAWAVPVEHDNAREPYGQLWRDHYGPVARDFGLWIAGVSNVGPIRSGPWAGRKCIGCSLLVGPDGGEVLQGPFGEDAETILFAEIQLQTRQARGAGWESAWSKIRSTLPLGGEG